MRDITTEDRNIAFLVFGLLLACYLFTYTGVIDSSDGLSMFATAESIVRRGEIDTNQLLWMGLQQGSFGPDGELYSRKGLGMTLLALPLIWLAKLWPAIGLAQAAMLLNPLLTAFTGALIYRFGRRLDWTRSTALATALFFGLATLAWPYAQTFFSDPVCGWALFAAFYGLLSYSQTGRKRYLLLSGLAWGIAYLARTINLVTLPVFVLGLLVVLRHRETLRRPIRPSTMADFLTLLANQWRPMISFLLPILLSGLVSLWWNWLRYGSVWDSGYVASETFSANWLVGISGLLIGPARGLIWYSPALLLGIFGGRWFWQQARWVLGMVLAISLIYLLVYGKWYMWHGGYSWGPRFLVPLMPFLALLTGPGWERLLRWSWGGRVLAGLLILLSVAVQWLGMLIPYSLVQDWLAGAVAPLFAPETFWQLGYSPLLLQWRFLQAANIHLAWWRNGLFDWFGFIMPLSGLLVGLALLFRHWQARQQVARSSRKYSTVARNWLYALALCLIAVAILTHQPRGPGSAIRTAAARIERAERQGEAILLLQPFQTQEFANAYHGSLPTYGFFSRNSPAADTEMSAEAWLAQLESRYPRLWVIPDYTPPAESSWERPLRVRDFLLQESPLPASDNGRLALYALAAAQAEPLVETGLGTIFGDPAQQEATITEENGWIRLQGYAVTAETTPGAEILLSLRWQSLRPVSNNYHVFVHLLNERDEKIDQRDGQPVQWMRPVSSWQPGEEIIDHYGLLLPEEMPPGEYRIAVGLYDPNNGQRLPVSAGPKDFAIEVGPITVASAH